MKRGGSFTTSRARQDPHALIIELLISLTIPLGLDLLMPVPEANPVTEQKVALGPRLFVDRRPVPTLTRLEGMWDGTWGARRLSTVLRRNAVILADRISAMLHGAG